MPSKKKKYNARFPAGRIKKIMQSDEEVGKVAQAVPIIISRTLELFVESLLEKTLKITTSRNAKTLSPSHMKQCIMAENRFDFLRELVKNIPDISVVEESGQDISPGPSTPSIITSGTTETTTTPITPTTTPPQQPFDLSMPSTSCNQIFDGQLFDIKNGGGGRRNQPRSCNGLQYSDITTTIHQQINISPTISSSTSTATSTTTSTPISPTTECRKELKRQWDTVHATRQTNHAISANFYKEQNNNSDNSLETDSDDDTKLFVTSPTKLRRMESTPNNIGSKTGNKSSKAAKKRFHHRSKSIPCNINDQNHHKLINSNLRRSATLTTSQKQQLPAPIVNIDTICNRPIVKIDYSNLDLNDKDPIESASISLSKSQTTNVTASPSSLSLSSLSTSTSLSSPSSSSMPIPLLVTPAAPAPATAPTNISPIINIDLSKLVTTSSIIPPSPSSSSSSSSLSSSSISMKNLFHNIVAGGEKSTTIQQTKLPTKLGSTTSLELDEDYDNI